MAQVRMGGHLSLHDVELFCLFSRLRLRDVQLRFCSLVRIIIACNCFLFSCLCPRDVQYFLYLIVCVFVTYNSFRSLVC